MNNVKLEQLDTFHLLTLGNQGQFNPAVLEEFNRALDEVDANQESQGLIITGEDKIFAQGLDLEFLSSVEAKEAQAFGDQCMAMIGRLLQFPVPVVTAINGHAFGLGALIALAGDYKVMRRDRGYFCLPEIDMGATMTPVINVFLRDKMSGNVLRDLLLTGKRVSGDEAAELGIVDCSSPLDTLLNTAVELAEPMLGKNRKALSGMKAGINQPVLDMINQ